MTQFLRCGLLAFALFLSALPLSAKELLLLDSVRAQATEATAEKYPDSDDVLLDNYIQVEYQTDGTSVSWDDTAIKVLTEKGKRDNRSLSLGYNTSYGTSTYTLVQVIKPDGTVHEIDIAAQSKEMVDPSQMSANIYNPNSKILKLSVPGLEIGDTLRYISHRIRTKTVVADTWSDYQVFEHASPIVSTTYEVIAPKALPLKRIALKSEIDGTIDFNKKESEQSDQIVYTWKVNNVPRMFDEPNMPTRYTVVQRLLVSTMDTWEDLSTWYWDICKPRLEATTPEMIAKANELVEGCTNSTDKIKAVFNFVSQDIRYMGITTEDEAPGYEPHDVSLTFSNRYGVCRDKAALLATMLRIVDIEAFPVIIMAGPKKDEEVPQPFFNHAVTAALDENGEYILMDSTDENTKDIFPSYLQNMSYIVARPEGETLLTSPIIPADDNLLQISTSGTLDKTGTLTANSTLVFEGVNDTVYRGYFSKIKPEERKRFFEGHVKRSMPTARLETLQILPKELRDTTQPLTIKLGYTAENLMIEGPENNMLNLPRLSSSLGYANFLLGQTGLEERKYPLYTRMTAGIRETLHLEIPADSGDVTIPGYQPIQNDSFSWNVQLAKHGNTLQSTNTFLLNTVEFSPAEYLVLKQDLKAVEYNLRKKLILTPAPANSNIDSDVRILDKSSSVVLKDASHWEETIRSKIEILTYSGKKKNSEIKLPYNPAWQEIKLTKAIVTHPDGTVKSIGEDEINIMDSSWVASAPRYPAEKILVANLPGVEIGSVLEYEIVSTVNGKPFFSTTQLFNGHEPVDLKTVTLTAPESMALSIQNKDIAETKTASDGTITYIWQAENQPAVKKEEALPPWWTFNPALFISTSDWKTYSDTVHEYLAAATQDQPATAALAQQLTDGIQSDQEKVIALRNWVAENLRQAGPALTSLPLSAITSADQTLKDRYGNNSDRMVVLHALLKGSGFNPEFILSGAVPFMPEAAKPLLEVPSRTAFNAVLLKLELDGETIYLSGSSQYAELGASLYNHRTMLNLADGSIETIEVASSKEDSGESTFTMAIDADGTANLAQTSILQGTAYEGFHKLYAEITPENRRRHYLEMITSVSQSAKAETELVTDYSTYPGQLSLAVTAERYAVQDGNYLYFTIPGGLGNLLKYRANERSLPLAWSSHIDNLVEYTIALPAGYTPAILPKNFSWQAPANAGTIEVNVDYDPATHSLHIEQIAYLLPALIPAEDFQDIMQASRKLSHPDMRTVLLKKTK